MEIGRHQQLQPVSELHAQMEELLCYCITVICQHRRTIGVMHYIRHPTVIDVGTASVLQLTLGVGAGYGRQLGTGNAVPECFSKRTLWSSIRSVGARAGEGNITDPQWSGMEGMNDFAQQSVMLC